MLQKQENIIRINQLPEIFQGYNTVVKQSLDVIDNNRDKWVEFIAHLSQFNQISVSDTLKEIDFLISTNNYNNQATLQAGLAKCYIAEGLFLKAIQTLGYAFTLLDNSDSDIQAFVILEMVNLLTVIGSRDNANYLLRTGQSLAKSEYLIRLYNYYNLVNQIRQGNLDLIDQLHQSESYFKKNKQYATLAFHYKNIGNAYGEIKEPELEKKYYKEGLKICKNNNYSHIQSAIEHDIAMSFYRSGNFNQALEKLGKIAKNAESYYTKAYIYGNIGFIYFNKKNYQSCIKSFKKALNVATENGVFQLIPSMCYYLGKSFQSDSKNTIAAEYFKKGYEASMELARYKFPIKGERLLVIDEYMKSMSIKEIDTSENSFSFAIDKTLDEIRGIFKNAVLNSLLTSKGSVFQVTKHLKISSSSYSKIKNRNKKYINIKTPKVIEEFIVNNPSSDWKKINKNFESNLLLCLYKEYKFNKRELSDKLNVDYSRLVTKMNQLEK